MNCVACGKPSEDEFCTRAVCLTYGSGACSPGPSIVNRTLRKVSTMNTSMTAEIDGGYGTVTIDKLTRHNGVAGAISVEIDATYNWSDDPTRPERSTATLVGSTYGAPLVFITGTGTQCFVSDPGRFGDFASDPIEYARRYVLGESL